MISTLLLLPTLVLAQEKTPWLQGTAYVIPKETNNNGSGYFAIVTGLDGTLYIGTAKYGENSYLVEFDPKTKQMKTVVDCHKEIGTNLKGFAAQSKIHTRNNVGKSGKIYFATKQGYPDPAKKEKYEDYPGGYPMVYDPKTGKTKVYTIPVKHHGIISITPDEDRGVAYLSTCSDTRPIDHSHFVILDLNTGKYRDLGDLEHMYAFIVVDNLGRAYHPIRGGQIARFTPAEKGGIEGGKLERLKQTIDGKPPTKESHLIDADSHPLNWDISPDGKTLYCVPMSTNQLYAYDLTAAGDTIPGRTVGPLAPTAKSTDCRALCVGPKGVVWAAITAPGKDGKVHSAHHLVSYKPGEKTTKLHGPVGIRNPNYTEFVDKAGKALPWHHGFTKAADGTFTSMYSILGVAQGLDGSVYSLALAPYTLIEVPPEQLK